MFCDFYLAGILENIVGLFWVSGHLKLGWPSALFFRRLSSNFGICPLFWLGWPSNFHENTGHLENFPKNTGLKGNFEN